MFRGNRGKFTSIFWATSLFVDNISGRMAKNSAEARKSLENRRFEYGLFWTHEMNEEFIRIRKESEERFAGKRSGSFPLRGWTHVLQEMGLENKLTAQQAKKRWENFVKKYKDEKDPMRVGKHPDEPIKWPLYHIMDWAVGARLEKIKPPVPFDPTENTENSNSEAAVNSILQQSEGQQELDATNQTGVFLMDQEDLSEDMEPPVLPPVNDTVDEIGELRRRNKKRKVTASSHKNYQAPPSPTPSATTSRSPSALRSTRHQSAMSARQQAAAILDAADSRHEEALLDIKSSLDELVTLQREQAESARVQAEASKRTATAIESLALSAERQASALERFATLVEERMPQTIVS